MLSISITAFCQDFDINFPVLTSVIKTVRFILESSIEKPFYTLRLVGLFSFNFVIPFLFFRVCILSILLKLKRTYS